ncbi:hypothetical protein AB1N83_007205 [Pleurotus pulmonarius]
MQSQGVLCSFSEKTTLLARLQVPSRKGLKGSRDELKRLARRYTVLRGPMQRRTITWLEAHTILIVARRGEFLREQSLESVSAVSVSPQFHTTASSFPVLHSRYFHMLADLC